MSPEEQREINQKFLGASKKNDWALVFELLARGADIEAKSKGGQTALMWSSGNGHGDAALMLVEKGADLETKDANGYTALMCATILGHADVALMLMEKGADLEAKSNNGKTALMWTSGSGRVDVALALLEKGADVEAKDKHGQTSLLVACSWGRIDVALALLAKGADVEAKDNNGRTVLIWTARSGNDGDALQYIAHGADSKTIPSDHAFYGFTPLQACAAGGFLPKLQALLDNPAPRRLACEQSQALMELALKYSQPDAAGLIQSHLAIKAIDDLLAGAEKNARQAEKTSH